jgi:hypothetical protein
LVSSHQLVSNFISPSGIRESIYRDKLSAKVEITSTITKG